MPKGLLSDPADNIATMLTGANAGDNVLISGKAGVGAFAVAASSDISMYHKIALIDIPEGMAILKYGNQIGVATRYIAKGEHVHVHNTASLRARRDS